MIKRIFKLFQKYTNSLKLDHYLLFIFFILINYALLTIGQKVLIIHKNNMAKLNDSDFLKIEELKAQMMQQYDPEFSQQIQGDLIKELHKSEIQIQQEKPSTAKRYD